MTVQRMRQIVQDVQDIQEELQSVRLRGVMLGLVTGILIGLMLARGLWFT